MFCLCDAMWRELDAYHANCDDVAMKVAHSAAVSAAGPRLGVSDACLLKHNRALPNLFVAR